MAQTFTLHPFSSEWNASTLNRIPMHLNDRMSLLTVLKSIPHRFASSEFVDFKANECPTSSQSVRTLDSGQRIGVESPVNSSPGEGKRSPMVYASSINILGNRCIPCIACNTGTSCCLSWWMCLAVVVRPISGYLSNSSATSSSLCPCTQCHGHHR